MVDEIYKIRIILEEGRLYETDPQKLRGQNKKKLDRFIELHSL